jgi:hypothetical protein
MVSCMRCKHSAQCVDRLVSRRRQVHLMQRAALASSCMALPHGGRRSQQDNRTTWRMQARGEFFHRLATWHGEPLEKDVAIGTDEVAVVP